MSLPMPILHAGGFSWDEALILVIAILAVPAISWFTGRMGKQKAAEEARPRRRRSTESSDDVATDPPPVE